MTIDRTAPTTSWSAPAYRLRSGTTLSGTALPVGLVWGATDGGGAGVATYDLGRSMNGGSWTLLAGRLTSSQSERTLTKGNGYALGAATSASWPSAR